MSEVELTVGDLKKELKGWPDETKLSFPGGLTFCRVERSGDNGAFIEFNEAQAFLSPEFKKKNPQLKVAFISTDSVEWDKEGLIGSVDVTLR
jgi:hypothetical protein